MLGTFIIGEDNLCPTTGEYCKKEKCKPGSMCDSYNPDQHIYNQAEIEYYFEHGGEKLQDAFVKGAKWAIENESLLNQLSRRINDSVRAKGFWDVERNKGELLMLVTSELGEALEADRAGKYADAKELKKLSEGGEYTWENSQLSFLHTFKRDIKDTFEDEIADAVIRLLDLAGGLGIDIDFHIKQKMLYNATRPIKHGKKY